MGKIDDFEKNLVQHGMTDEDFIEYEKLLKRVQGNFLKRQHCYTTAIQFSRQYAEQAIQLIQYGLDNFEDDWFSTYTSYVYMGHIFEDIGNYQKAYESYILAKDALGLEHAEYIGELSKDLMWMKLHIDSFGYSKELEEYFNCYKDSNNDFSKSFVNSEFKISVVYIVVLMYRGQIDEAKEYLENARKISNPNYVGKLYNILARHKYQEAFKATPEALAFIKQLKI